MKIEYYKKSEEFFLKHGEISTFVGRFLPGVRSLISFPPGIFKMNIIKFSLYTVLASSIANALLLTVGYIAGKNEVLIKKMTSEIMFLLVVVLGTIVGIYIQYVKSQKKSLQKIEKVIEDNLKEEEKELQEEEMSSEKKQEKKHKKHPKKK